MTAASGSQFQRAMPVLECRDLGRSVTFYKEKLGFSASTWGEPATFAILQRGAVTLALNVAVSPSVSRKAWAVYVYVADVDALYAELLALGVALPHAPVTQTEYGCRDFTLDDPDGHLIAFGQVRSPNVLGPGLSERIGRDGNIAAQGGRDAGAGEGPWSGGCQCGAVRFRIDALGRASFCHCRMCQKAFGATGGALVTAKGLAWTRGSPAHFQSSTRIRRGFCSACGTPLTFEYDGLVDVAIPAFDRAGEIVPVIQYSPEAQLPWTASIPSLPGYPPEEHDRRQAWFASIVSHQHPDHDTDHWPSPETHP